MKKQNGVTLITVVIMVIVISIISVASIISSREIFSESKENVLKNNRFLVETAVSKYSAKASTSGVFTPANQQFPGEKNPSFDYVENVDGSEIKEKRNVGEDWYLLLEDDLEEMGIEYVEETYLVNYKLNIVIPLSSSTDIFQQVAYYENNNK